MSTNKIDLVRAEVEKLKSQLLRGACSSQVAMEAHCKEEAYNEVLTFIDSLQEEPDPYIQYASRESAIKAHAEDYSWNIESELFLQLTHEQQKMWRKEIEQAVISGGYCGLNLATDNRYNQEEPVSEDLEEAASSFARRDSEEISNPANFYYVVADKVRIFKAGAMWQKEQFEKNRLKHCDSITNEQAELEQGFVDKHLDKHQRIPTFLDAIEYGMNLQKEQMIKNAVDGVVAESAGGDGWVNIATGFVKSEDVNVKFGDKIKIIVVKED